MHKGNSKPNNLKTYIIVQDFSLYNGFYLLIPFKVIYLSLIIKNIDAPKTNFEHML